MFAFADDSLIDKDTALKITTGFGGGIALTGDICGACSAGVMLLRLKFGRGLNEKIAEVADYVSEVKAIKHPFDKGISARRGIEY